MAKEFLPLFLDRLADPRRGDVSKSHLVWTREEVLESIRREVTALLNTRRNALAARSEPGEFSVINYGLAELLQLCPGDSVDRERVAHQLALAIEGFEPRLADVRVEVTANPASPTQLRIQIEAHLRIDAVASPVNFSIAVGQPIL